MNNQLNFSGFSNLKLPKTIFEMWKAYTEGIYSDTPSNRKLGRVGMSYLDYERKTKKESEEKAKAKEEEEYNQSESERKAKLSPPKEMSEGLRKKNFSNFETGDTIYLKDTYKSKEGNYEISSIKPISQKGKLMQVTLTDSEGNEVQFLKDFLTGYEPFEGFKIMDLNYSLQEDSKGFISKKAALENFKFQMDNFAKKDNKSSVSDEFTKEDIKIAFGSVVDFEQKTKNIDVEPWGITVEINYKDKNTVFIIEPSAKNTYKISKFTPSSTGRVEEGKYEKHPDFQKDLTAKELVAAVKSIYKNSK